MSKMVKELIVGELKSRYAGLDSALMVELVGCDGITTNDFRRALHSKKVKIEIVRNSLLRKAVGDGKLGPLVNRIAGPNALVTGGENVIEVAKLIEEWMPKIAGLKLRAAILEGEYIDERAVAHLSKMPTKRDLQAKIAGQVLAPGGKLAAAILSGGGGIAACVKAIAEKLEKGETITRLSA